MGRLLNLRVDVGLEPVEPAPQVLLPLVRLHIGLLASCQFHPAEASSHWLTLPRGGAWILSSSSRSTFIACVLVPACGSCLPVPCLSDPQADRGFGCLGSVNGELPSGVLARVFLELV